MISVDLDVRMDTRKAECVSVCQVVVPLSAMEAWLAAARTYEISRISRAPGPVRQLLGTPCAASIV